MKIKLVINGENHKINILPEDRVDKMLLAFLAENTATNIVVNRNEGIYSNREIEYINLILLKKSIVNIVGEDITKKVEEEFRPLIGHFLVNPTLENQPFVNMLQSAKKNIIHAIRIQANG